MAKPINPAAMTTGMVARLFGVCPRTVCKWIDTGLLKGRRIPGGDDRRVTLNDLMAFATDQKYDLVWLASQIRANS